ncbi:MAG TPA: TfoX/Sxy family protein [Xanthobacteraceae bacterium]|nr:TfoX/Sxy family protein [Xanthobacteraceae bacterium]
MEAAALREMFSAFGPVDVRRMFGGAGIFADGMMIALASREIVYLKSDADTAPAFDREGMEPFSYATRGGGLRVMTQYRRMPDRLYDDPDELAQWARAALGVAARAAARAGRTTGRKGKASPRKAIPPGF